jgi:hypothetical protein
MVTIPKALSFMIDFPPKCSRSAAAGFAEGATSEEYRFREQVRHAELATDF